MSSLFLRAFAVVALLSLSTAVQASRVSPMAVDLEPSGRGTVARVQFVNTASHDFPIEARAFRGEITEDGELELTPADDDFIIFPPQRVIEPLGEQVIRLQYIGNPDIDRAQVYYLSIHQLPVQLEPGAPKIQVLVNFNVFVNVEPDNASPSPRVDTVVATTKDEIDGVEVRIVNDGNGMLRAGEMSWTAAGTKSDGSAYERKFTPAELAGLIGVGVVAPGKARKFFLPIKDGVDRESVSITIK